MNNNIITTFTLIRDLPYEIGPLYEGASLIKYGKGGCGPKNRYLAQYFYQNKYKVKVCNTPYRWSDLDCLPAELKNHPRVQKTGTHVYLKVLINKQWVIIDASWDAKLYPILPANLGWNGKSNQIPATKITQETCFDYPEPYLTNRKAIKQSKPTRDDLEFAKKMNNWFNSIRNYNR